MPDLATTLQTAVDGATADAGTLHQIIHGPESGPGSTVNTEQGPVDTMAKRAAAMDLSEEAAAASAVAADASADAASASATAADTSADAAAAAKATIDAAVAAGTFTGAGVRVAPPLTGLTSLTVSQDGAELARTVETGELAGPLLQSSLSVNVHASGHGSRVETVAAIQAGDSSHAWSGPAFDGALWLASPAIVSGDLTVKVNWNRRGLADEWRDGILNASGLVLATDLVENVTLVVPSSGQSLATGGSPSFTSAAPDATYAQMIANTSAFAHPLFSPIFAEAGLTGLRHDSGLNPSGYGETHLASMALTLLALMDANGDKIPGVYFTCGAGGHSLRDLDEDSAPYVPQSRAGNAWANLRRACSYAKNTLVSAGKVPAFAPLVFIHGEEDSNDLNFGTTALQYADGLDRIVERFNRDLSDLCGWHPSAPQLPIIVTQTRRTPPTMWSASTTKVLRRGVDGPMLGQWGAAARNPRIVMAGPNYHLPVAGDGSHLSGAGYFRLGEQIGRQMWNILFGTGPKYFRPIAVIRQSTTAFDIVFQVPSGNLALDTNIADALDGMKGFVAWDNAANSPLSLASVAIQAADTVRVTLASAAASTVEVWCDYALWGDGSSYLAQTVTGPRGSLRTSTAYSSLISSYGGASTTDYDWCPAFRIPVPVWSGSAATRRLDGRL